MINGIISTVVGGSILTFIFFAIREYIFPPPKITGNWYVRTHTIETSYNPYKKMELDFMFMIWVEGNRVYGTCEKIHENSSTGKREYIGKDRKSGIIDGFIEKKYLKKDIIILHVVIDDFGRKSTYIFELEEDRNFIFKRSDLITGNFTSMVANQKGYTTWSKCKFE